VKITHVAMLRVIWPGAHLIFRITAIGELAVIFNYNAGVRNRKANAGCPGGVVGILNQLKRQGCEALQISELRA
jgi:hypothetical protein